MDEIFCRILLDCKCRLASCRRFEAADSHPVVRSLLIFFVVVEKIVNIKKQRAFKMIMSSYTPFSRYDRNFVD